MYATSCTCWFILTSWLGLYGISSQTDTGHTIGVLAVISSPSGLFTTVHSDMYKHIWVVLTDNCRFAVNFHKFLFLFFLSCICYAYAWHRHEQRVCLSVCPSICPSHVVHSRQMNIQSYSFNQPVATGLQFFRSTFIPWITEEHLLRGCQDFGG